MIERKMKHLIIVKNHYQVIPILIIIQFRINNNQMMILFMKKCQIQEDLVIPSYIN